jgi:Ca2+-binding EF-hand superfamily protein
MASLSDSELKEYKEHFASFDQDGNGKIEKAELVTVLQNLKLYTSAKQVHYYTFTIILTYNHIMIDH